jgi:hypothetical protein
MVNGRPELLTTAVVPAGLDPSKTGRAKGVRCGGRDRGPRRMRRAVPEYYGIHRLATLSTVRGRYLCRGDEPSMVGSCHSRA